MLSSNTSYVVCNYICIRLYLEFIGCIIFLFRYICIMYVSHLNLRDEEQRQKNYKKCPTKFSCRYLRNRSVTNCFIFKNNTTVQAIIFRLLIRKVHVGTSVTGLPDFSRYTIPKPEKSTKRTQKLPNGNKISQISVKYSKWP
jgi:hypothetical protein